MADYFTNFSLDVKLPTEEAQKYALDLTNQARAGNQGVELPDSFPKSLRDVVEDWNFETVEDHSPEGRGIWLHTQYGGVDAVCAFIQHLLQQYDPDGCVTLEWSNDCSKPRVDAFGGGAAIITARRIKSISTGEWLHKRLAIIGARNTTRQQSTPLNTN